MARIGVVESVNLDMVATAPRLPRPGETVTDATFLLDADGAVVPGAVDLATDVATFTGVIMEQVVALEPDLVLAAGNGLTKPEEIATMRELVTRPSAWKLPIPSLT